jgi:hypothetical protein
MAVSKTRVVALSVLFVLIGSGITGTGCKAKAETCTITWRDIHNATLSCKDDKGARTRDETIDVPGDLYPKCQVGNIWPTCKEK